MVKHSFKIGDKVKLKGSYCGVSSKATGKVVGVRGYIEVLWGGDLLERLGRGRKYPHTAYEIEHAAKVGEQLQFSFMMP